ncbi:hypothetical protein ACLOJK_030313 [Asimina triloba]
MAMIDISSRHGRLEVAQQQNSATLDWRQTSRPPANRFVGREVAQTTGENRAENRHRDSFEKKLPERREEPEAREEGAENAREAAAIFHGVGWFLRWRAWKSRSLDFSSATSAADACIREDRHAKNGSAESARERVTEFLGCCELIGKSSPITGDKGIATKIRRIAEETWTR